VSSINLYGHTASISLSAIRSIFYCVINTEQRKRQHNEVLRSHYHTSCAMVATNSSYIICVDCCCWWLLLCCFHRIFSCMLLLPLPDPVHSVLYKAEITRCRVGVAVDAVVFVTASLLARCLATHQRTGACGDGTATSDIQQHCVTSRHCVDASWLRCQRQT